MKMVMLFVLLFVLNGCVCVLLPGCGEIDDIKWNNSCLLSKIEEKSSDNFSILELSNILLYDNVFYYIVPPKITTQDEKMSIQEKIYGFLEGGSEEEKKLQFKAVNVSRSPLMFGKSQEQYAIKSVKHFQNGILVHYQNFKQKVHPQLEVEGELTYVPVEDVFQILCRGVSGCELDDQLRKDTLILTTVRYQSHVDWDNGINIDCFTNHGIFPIEQSFFYNRRLFIFKKLVMYKPIQNSQNNQNSTQLIKKQCRKDSLSYDPTGVSEQTKIYNVSICTVFKNEAKYLLEWIAYHNLIGVDHFYLYDDNSSDDFENLLQPMIDSNLVTLHKRSNNLIPLLAQKIKVQRTFLSHCGYKYAYQTKWLLSIDIDEFLVINNPKFNNNIYSWISSNHEIMKQTGAVQIPREVFAGHYEPITKKQIVTSEVIYKSAPQYTQDFKPLINTNGLDRLTVHYGLTYLPIRNSLFSKDIKLDQLTLLADFAAESNCTVIKDVSVFHYIVRSYEECILKSNQHLFQSSFRSQRGDTFCKQMVWGFKHYPQLWKKDTHLATQNFTQLICQKMALLNQEWFDGYQMCSDYSF